MTTQLMQNPTRLMNRKRGNAVVCDLVLPKVQT